MVIKKSKKPNKEGYCWYFEDKKYLGNNKAVITISKKYKTPEDALNALDEYRKNKLMEVIADERL